MAESKKEVFRRPEISAVKLEEAAEIINSCLTWVYTPEGSTYWSTVHQRLLRKAKDAAEYARAAGESISDAPAVPVVASPTPAPTPALAIAPERAALDALLRSQPSVE